MPKHPSVDEFTLVELDDTVVRIAKEHFGAIHRGVFDQPKLDLVIADRLKYLAQTTERFDLIAFDLPDPIGPAERLYESGFFAHCKRALAPGGIMTLHMGSGVSRPDRVRAIDQRLAAAFEVVKPFVMFIPPYGSLWRMACCSNSRDPTDVPAAKVDRRITTRNVHLLQNYTSTAPPIVRYSPCQTTCAT